MGLSQQLEEASIRYRVTRANRGATINVRAYAGKKVVGRMGATRTTPYYFDVGALVVDDQVQREGVATELFTKLVKTACAEGAKGIRSEGFQRSATATRFWKSLVAKGKARMDGQDFYAEC